MTVKNTIRQFIYMFLPAIVFRTIYGYFGLYIAIISSLILTVSVMVSNHRKNGRVENTLIKSLSILILSFLGSVISSNERFYFIPPLLQTVFFIIWILIFMIRKKCYVFLFAKDFNIPYLDEMDEKDFLSLNYIWLFIFCLKFVIKTISLVYMDLPFVTLYWISFLSGDPITLPVIYYTYRYFDKKIKAYVNAKT